mmetsp:Transcript_72139/g.200097  ORF Transcript_72139/g.200097 Transcript_72139/m.200097 type:complete len:244 (-) Transcript_72139:149-880(-)
MRNVGSRGGSAVPSNLRGAMLKRRVPPLEAEAINVNRGMCCGFSRASFFGAIPNPVNIFKLREGKSVGIRPGETLWSKDNPRQLEWGSLDDVVMGGASRSSFDGALWEGTVITNGGGFVGIRTRALEPAYDVSACSGLRLRVRGGDGQRFKLFIRDSYDWNGIAWSYSFDTGTLFPGGQVEVSARFDEFVPTLFARRVPGKRFDTTQLTTFQVTLSKFEYDGDLNPNFRPGDFSLEVLSIETF